MNVRGVQSISLPSITSQKNDEFTDLMQFAWEPQHQASPQLHENSMSGAAGSWPLWFTKHRLRCDDRHRRLTNRSIEDEGLADCAFSGRYCLRAVSAALPSFSFCRQPQFWPGIMIFPFWRKSLSATRILAPKITYNCPFGTHWDYLASNYKQIMTI